MPTPLQLTKGEASVGKLVTRNGIIFGDNTLQTTAIEGTTHPVRFTPIFQAEGLTYTGSGTTHPAYDSFYVKIGSIISFNIHIKMTTVTNFGTGQLKTSLPFLPYNQSMNHFPAWVWVDPTEPADELNGHVIMQADHLAGETTLDLHWFKETTAAPKPVIESLFIQGTPVTMTTLSEIYVNGTYIIA